MCTKFLLVHRYIGRRLETVSHDRKTNGRSGDWAYRVGLPGKSGVGGGILAVVPGVMGIAAFSPPLDEEGNSVRGQKMVASVANQLGYNVFKG